MISKTCLFLAILAAPMAASAQSDASASEESSSGLSWNLSLTSDYVFRGVSQTMRDPAIQGGLDYSFGDNGWYVGTWASNIDYGSNSPNIELDTYVGWTHDVSQDWNVDLSLVRYNYLGAGTGYGNIDYNELIGKVTWNENVTLTLGYTNDYANSSQSATYVALSGSWDVGKGFNVSASAGRSGFSGGGDYNDWMIGVSRQCGPANIGLSYYDTNISGPRVSDGLVLSIAFGN